MVDVLPVMLLLGTGAGLCFPALMTLAMSGATQEDAGLASGLVNTTLQVGGALGLAVLATLSTTRADGLLADGERTASALTSGYHLAFAIGAGLLVAAIAVAVDGARARGGGRGARGDERAGGGARLLRGRLASVRGPRLKPRPRTGDGLSTPRIFSTQAPSSRGGSAKPRNSIRSAPGYRRSATHAGRPPRRSVAP